jgi:hypothetical protein
VALYYLLCRYFGERRIPWRIRAHRAFDRNALGQRRVRSGDPRRNRTGNRSLSRHGRGSRDARAPRKERIGFVVDWRADCRAGRQGQTPFQDGRRWRSGPQGRSKDSRATSGWIVVANRMRPPVVAAALIAAFAPPNDYESIAGDLHEKYFRYAHCSTTRAANRWYWSQVLLSIPSLLSYSRVRRSALQAAGVGVAILAVLMAMLLATVPINALLESYLAAPSDGRLGCYFARIGPTPPSSAQFLR